MCVLGMLGVSFAYRAGLASRAARRQMLLAQLKAQANSAALVALGRLEQDTDSFDHPAQPWARHAPLATEAWLEDWAEPNRPDALAEFEADYEVIDEAGKLNLAFASSEALEKLGLSSEQIAALREWTDSDENGSNDFYLSLPQPYRCKSAPIQVLEELTLIRGFGARAYLGRLAAPWDAQTSNGVAASPGHARAGLVELLTVVGDGKMNLNTAPEAVLRTLPISEDAVRQILAYRVSPSSFSEDIASHAFRRAEDIDQLQGLSNADRAVLHGLARFKSEYFRIVAWARHRPSGLCCQLEVLVRRGDQGARVLQWRASQ